MAGAALLVAAIVVAVLVNILGPVRVAAVHPQRGPLTDEVFGTGTLEAKVVVAFSAKVIGKVVGVLVDQGDTVTEGQILARLEATDFEQSVRVAEAGIGQARAELTKARLDVGRNRALLEAASISQSQFDGYEAAYRVAEAKLRSAEAQLGFTRARLADTIVSSPIAGLVLTRNLEVGDTVVPGAPIFRIADTRQLWVTAMVDEWAAGKLRVGQPARVILRAHPGRTFPGHLARLAEEADRVTEEREADVTVDQLPLETFIGAKADVYIEAAREPDALQIPKIALVPHGDEPGVLVIDAGRARWRPVKLGVIGRDAAQLVAGVNAEDLVIAPPFDGKGPIAEGQRVAAVAAAGEAR